MTNVSRLLLERARKAERVLATMVKANDFIEEVCDQEIASLMDRITEMEKEHDEIRHKAYDDGFKDGQEQAEHEAQQVDEEESEREARRLQAYDREQFYRDLDDQKGEVPTY